MNKLIRLFALLAITGLCVSCYVQQPLSVEQAANNKTYDVEYLFEHDGCKVYRFKDNGDYVYFTNVRSDVTSIPNDSTVVMNKVRELETSVEH